MSERKNTGQEKNPCPQCEIYLNALYALTRKDFTFTEEELRDLREHGQSLDPVIEEVERRVGA